MSSSSSKSPPGGPQSITEQSDGKKENSKRRRNQLSCAECRRLKLRCDRVFPCESCRKRGCAAICPEGALMTKGTRFVLANTEELHVKIMDMSERIRQLENALSASSPDPHPLLREDLLLIKVPIEFKNDANSPPKDAPPESPAREKDGFPTLLDAFGTLKIGADGHSRFFGQTARTEHFVKDETDPPPPDLSDVHPLLPTDILRLSQAFPFGSSARDIPMLELIMDYIPPIAEAWAIVDTYYTNEAWVYEPCPRSQFEEEILKHVYENLKNPEGMLPHRLALFFSILSHGVLLDFNREPYPAYAEQLHQLSRACLAASAFLQEPTLPVVQAMFFIGFYLVLVNKKEAASTGWALQGLNCKLAEMLGLHRDLDYWDAEDKRSHGEARRKVFWELLTLDGWMSLGLGRPATIHFSQIDCKMPAASQRAMNNPDLHNWHTWKHGYMQFVSKVLQKALDSQTPPYEDILDLDRGIHAYGMPADVEALANGLPFQSAQPDSLGLTMQRWLLLQVRSTLILLLHRGFFAQALSEKADPMQSKFAPSVLATYRSACYIILALHNVYTQYPGLTSRFGPFWSNAFSASIALCLMVTRATRSSYAPFALGQLELAYELFRRAAHECAPAAKALPIATRLRDKAHAAYAPYRNGQHPASLASKRAHVDDDDELNILGGKTHLVAAPPPPTSSPSQTNETAVAPQLYSELSYPTPTSPGMVLQLPPTNHLDSVHPSLVRYLIQSPVHRSQSVGTEQQFMHTNVYPQPPQRDGPTQDTYNNNSYNPSTYVSNLPPVGTSSLGPPIPAYDMPTQAPTAEQEQELHQPRPQPHQYAAWQNYMEQLGLPY